MIRLLAAVALTLPLVSTAVAAERTFDLAVVRGRLSGSPATIRVHQGDNVVLRWHSDRPVTLHLHGYDVETPVVPGAIAETRFVARAAGRFPVHLHESRARSETVLVYLEVYPE